MINQTAMQICVNGDGTITIDNHIYHNRNEVLIDYPELKENNMLYFVFDEEVNLLRQ